MSLLLYEGWCRRWTSGDVAHEFRRSSYAGFGPFSVRHWEWDWVVLFMGVLEEMGVLYYTSSCTMHANLMHVVDADEAQG